MPLLDHFHPPVENQFPWDSFHTTWATRIADALNDHWLTSEFIAAEHTHAGSSLEIDIATFERPSGRPASPPNGPPVATVARPTWTPPAVARTMPAVFPDSFEVRVFSTPGGLTLVAAIELISPGNKDRADKRTGLRRQVRQLPPSRGRSYRHRCRDEPARQSAQRNHAPDRARRTISSCRPKWSCTPSPIGRCCGRRSRKSTCGRRPSPSVSRCRRCRCG